MNSRLTTREFFISALPSWDDEEGPARQPPSDALTVAGHDPTTESA